MQRRNYNNWYHQNPYHEGRSALINSNTRSLHHHNHRGSSSKSRINMKNILMMLGLLMVGLMVMGTLTTRTWNLNSSNNNNNSILDPSSRIDVGKVKVTTSSKTYTNENASVVSDANIDEKSTSNEDGSGRVKQVTVSTPIDGLGSSSLSSGSIRGSANTSDASSSTAEKTSTDEEERDTGRDVHADTDVDAAPDTGSDAKSIANIESDIDRKVMIEKIREEFYARYGGKEEASKMLEKGIIPASKDVKATRHTAERIIRAKRKNDFVISFGGYSVTVGRGNFYHQSYPFVMQKVLQPIFESMDLNLIVRNSAIGGIPSFPYGFCLPNFLGMDSDVVSWDYGMNEGNGADAFESYLRHSMSTLPKRPMMIMLDTKARRVDMLKKYSANGSLLDSIAVSRADGIVNKAILEKDESELPEGFQNWDEWGGPKGSPGQSPWHPKYKEHELIGWMIAMHFLDAVEMALDMDEHDVEADDEHHKKLALLPKPVSTVEKTGRSDSPSHLLFGVPIDESDEDSLWHMDPVSCRTSFLPNIHGGMSEIIVSGLAEGVGDDLQSRDDEQYGSGWVVDVGKVERDTKRKVKKVGGLGYIDMKNALYGIHGSGPLELSLPHEGPVHKHADEHDSDMLASHWFDTIVFCEVNEKRGADECKPERDMSFVVGGANAEAVQITSAASYLSKSICINVSIPDDAKVSFKAADEGSGTGTGTREDKMQVELKVEVTVTGENVTRENGACSISHIVWQSH